MNSYLKDRLTLALTFWTPQIMFLHHFRSMSSMLS
jgi:hypothetical protein